MGRHSPLGKRCNFNLGTPLSVIILTEDIQSMRGIMRTCNDQGTKTGLKGHNVYEVTKAW